MVMAYRAPEKVSGGFGRWLDNMLFACNKSAREVAEALRISANTVRYHRRGTLRPTFPDVVAYCWYFTTQCVPNVGHPHKVWEVVQKDIGGN